MDRIQAAQPATISATWERAGVPVDPGPGVTVTITSSRTGAAIVQNAATNGFPGVSRTYDLTPAQTANLDYLTCQWTAGDGSVLMTYVEIVAGFYFSIAAARARSPLADSTTYTTQRLLDYRTMAEKAIEDICGVAFLPRFSLDKASISGMGLLKLPRRHIRTVQNIYTQTNNGPQALPTLAGLRIMPGGQIFMPSFWNWWSMPISVAYEHGFDSIPPRVSRAALELCRRWIVESPWDERTTGFRTRDGGEMQILTAGTSGATATARVTNAFDIPEVQAIAEAYGTPAVV